MKDLVIRASIWTGRPERPWAEAAAVRHGRFVSVGSLAEARAACPGAEEEDWSGNMMMPGMTDAHMHLTAFARQSLYVDLLSVRGLDEAAAMLKGRAAEIGPGKWIRAVNYNEMAWEDRRPPTKEWLDSLGLPNPVLMSRYCGHRHVANSLAMEQSGLKDSPDPYVLRDERGAATGVMTEGGAAPAVEAAAAQWETPEKLTEAMARAAECLVSQGVTCVHACDAPGYALGEEVFTWQNLQEQGRLPIRIVCYHDAMPNFAFRSGMGNGQIIYGGFKTFLDGTLGGHTAAMRAPFSDMPGTCGVPNHSDEELYRQFCEAHRRGIQVQAHMIGDAAVEQAIRVTERVVAELGRPRLPYRFNHVILCPADLRERLKQLPAALDLQPCQSYTDRVMAPLRLGDERRRDAYPFRALWDTGLPVIGSTDAPMERENLWIGIWNAVCRCDDGGRPLPYDPSQKLTLDEALQAYTVNAWRVLGMGGSHGQIREGRVADFTVTEGNPFERPAMELKNTRHLATWLGGRKVWSR